MKNENLLWIILKSIFLILFNVVFFFLGGFDRPASVWISYGFIHFAYFMLLLTPQLTRGKKSWTELGIPLYYVSSIYFFVQFAIGLFFILVFSLTGLESYVIPFLMQLGLAGLYGVILVAHMIANERTVDAVEKRQPQISFIKEATAKIKSLLENINDVEEKKKIERVYDTLYSSPVKSHPDIAPVETHILQSIRALEVATCSENRDCIIDLADSLEIAINERNRQLKTYN